jgi:carboxylesterase type B
MISNSQQEDMFNKFLSILNVSTISEARKLPSETIIRANALQVRNSPYGTYSYGITVDGDLVPALPSAFFATGHFDMKVEVMMGYNANEGIIFTSPVVTSEQALEDTIREIFPTITTKNLNYMTQTLYPPVYDGSQGYADLIARVSRIRADAIIVSNICTLNNTYPNSTHVYKFKVDSPLHGFDIQYTFYEGGGTRPINLQELTGMANPQAALTLQQWITDFVRRESWISERWGGWEYGCA